MCTLESHFHILGISPTEAECDVLWVNRFMIQVMNLTLAKSEVLSYTKLYNQLGFAITYCRPGPRDTEWVGIQSVPVLMKFSGSWERVSRKQLGASLQKCNDRGRHPASSQEWGRGLPSGLTPGSGGPGADLVSWCNFSWEGNPNGTCRSGSQDIRKSPN